MKLEDYYNGVIVGVMAALAAGGVPTIATTWKGDGSDSRRREPGFSVGLVLTYVPVAYLLGGLVVLLVVSSNAYVNAFLILITFVTIHVYYTSNVRRASVNQLQYDPGSIAQIREFREPEHAEQLRTTCAKDLEHANRIRLVSPSIKEFFSPSFILSKVLLEAISRGTGVELLADGIVKSSADLSLGIEAARGLELVGMDRVEASGRWLILDAGKVIYFGVASPGSRLSDIPVFRVVFADDTPDPQIGTAISDMLNSLFKSARSSESLTRVNTSSSPREYRERIIEAEAGAKTIDRIPKRLSVVFKGEDTVRTIAEQRFGVGSPSVGYYVDEHKERRAEFFDALRRGMTCREIYNETEVVKYVRSRLHSNAVRLDYKEVVDTVFRWRRAVEMHDNYMVALTNDPLPFKYELVDGRLVSMHEAIGVSDSLRLNAIFLEGIAVGESFARDFETIWERVPPVKRSRAEVLRFIDQDLVPLTRTPDSSKEQSAS